MISGTFLARDAPKYTTPFVSFIEYQFHWKYQVNLLDPGDTMRPFINMG